MHILNTKLMSELFKYKASCQLFWLIKKYIAIKIYDFLKITRYKINNKFWTLHKASIPVIIIIWKR